MYSTIQPILDLFNKKYLSKFRKHQGFLQYKDTENQVLIPLIYIHFKQTWLSEVEKSKTKQNENHK